MRRFLLATGLIALGAVVSTSIVFAAGAVVPFGHQWFGGGSGSGCGTAFHTMQSDFDVQEENGDFDTLTPASYVDFTKKCHGAAVATWSSEVWQEFTEVTTASHDDLEVVLRATCTHPLPFVSNPCHTGDRVYGEPGAEDDPVVIRESVDSGNAQVYSMQWAFIDLKPGSWRIEVLAGEGEDLVLGYRTLHFETL
ncbi:MAG TPA: hypothetical protein VFR32_11800 [Gaiellaceae bacterium]|nr:hypothetical protein [Gaiellaceae bacterium]